MGRAEGFRFESTADWARLAFITKDSFQVLIFLDRRSEEASQREGFQRNMNSVGGWMGFHFAGFALTPLAFNMGHNDLDYEGGTNRTLSSTFSSAEQNRVIVQGMLWLRNGRTKHIIK